jgi:hypothetical protein
MYDVHMSRVTYFNIAYFYQMTLFTKTFHQYTRCKAVWDPIAK